MDFNSVLSVAKDNKRYASYEIPVKRYSTDVPPPKKTEKNTVQSDAIRKFLAKKEKEEHKKAAEADQRKKDLLELRAIAKHNRKATQMAKRTKDNNFMAHIPTAELLAQEAAAAEKLKSQDTSDRYRYFKPPRVGADSSVIAQRPKMVTLEPPPEPQTSRVQNGHRVRTDPPQPPPPRHVGLDAKSQSDKKKLSEARTIKRPLAPPPPNFYDLLQLAAKKQHEPIDLPKIPKKKIKDEDVQGRPMTCDEKRRFLEEQTRKQGRSLSTVQLPATAKKRRRFRENEEREEYVAETLIAPKNTPPPPPPQTKPPERALKSSSGTVMKKSTNLQSVMLERTKVSNGEKRISRQGPVLHPEERAQSSAVRHKDLRISKVESLAGRTNAFPKTGPIAQSSQRPSVAMERNPLQCRPVKTKSVPPSVDRTRAPLPNERQVREPKLARDALVTTNGKINQVPSKFPPPTKRSLPVKGSEPKRDVVSSQSRERPSNPESRKSVVDKRPLADRHNLSMQALSREKAMERRLAQQELNQQPRTRDNLNTKASLPRSELPKQFPPRDFMPRRFPPEDVRRPPLRPVKRRIESDDEYDAEMDDFIDDGPLEDDFNYSQHIKEIFGYDRARYQYEPDDGNDGAMESSFAQMMREEAISTKIGILEDLEDIRREQLELEQKARRKKRK